MLNGSPGGSANCYGVMGVDDVIALQLPGFGCPRPAGFGATKEEYVAWLIGELECIKAQRPIDLAGHCWGGGFVLRSVSTRPDLVRSWVCDAAGLGDINFEWHDFAKIWQTPGEGEKFYEDNLAVPADERGAVFEMSEAKRWLLGGYQHGLIGGLAHAVATEMAFAFRFSAERLHELGWLNRLTDPEDLLPAAREMAAHLLTLPPASRVNTVHMMRQMRPTPTPELQQLAGALHEHGAKSDLMESRAAFAEMDADHVSAWSKGGGSTAENCQMLCATHNRAKGNR